MKKGGLIVYGKKRSFERKELIKGDKKTNM
jgi:hypothetical protein